MKQQSDRAVLELLLAEASADETRPRAPAAVVVGTLTGFDEIGQPRIELSTSTDHEPVTGRSIIALAQGEVGRQVVLAFEGGDPEKPIVMGVIQTARRVEAVTGSVRTPEPVQADIDGETLQLTAKKEIVLRCGKSSITLTRAGKILLRGAYLLSRSSGVNRIKGGSVQIN
jgi:hypothetical protein